MKASLHLAHALTEPLMAAAVLPQDGGRAFAATLHPLIPIIPRGEALAPSAAMAGPVMTISATATPRCAPSKQVTASVTGIVLRGAHGMAEALPKEADVMRPAPIVMPAAPTNAATKAGISGTGDISDAIDERSLPMPDLSRFPEGRTASSTILHPEVLVALPLQAAASNRPDNPKRGKAERSTQKSEEGQGKKDAPSSKSPLMVSAQPVIAVPTPVNQCMQVSDTVPVTKMDSDGGGKVHPPSSLHASSSPIHRDSGSRNQEAEQPSAHTAAVPAFSHLVAPNARTAPTADSRAPASSSSHAGPDATGDKPKSASNDDRIVKEGAKTGIADGKDWTARSEPADFSQIVDLVQHTTTQDATAPAQKLQRHGEPHSFQAGALQVLQRMDASASSAPVRLHADARQLHVGVTSAALGWVEVRATSGPDGRVDAALHVQSDASAHMLEAHSKEISNFAHEHSVALGQVSVGVGTGGNSERRDSSAAYSGMREETRSQGQKPGRPLRSAKREYHAIDRVTLISVQA